MIRRRQPCEECAYMCVCVCVCVFIGATTDRSEEMRAKLDGKQKCLMGIEDSILTCFFFNKNKRN